MSTPTINRTSVVAGPDNHPYIPLYMYILVSVFNTAIFILGTFGNVLVLLVIVKVRNMRTPTNFFLMCLSIADILVLLVCQPAALMEFFAKDRWFIGRAMCKSLIFMLITLCNLFNVFRQTDLSKVYRPDQKQNKKEKNEDTQEITQSRSKPSPCTKSRRDVEPILTKQTPHMKPLAYEQAGIATEDPQRNGQ